MPQELGFDCETHFRIFGRWYPSPDPDPLRKTVVGYGIERTAEQETLAGLRDLFAGMAFMEERRIWEANWRAWTEFQ